MRWLITEKAEYLVEADSKEAAEREFLESGPSCDDDGGVAFVGVVDRVIEEADE